MQNYSEDTFPLSEIAWQILLLLSSRQSLSSHEIARAIDHSLDSVAIGLKELERFKYVSHSDGKYQITREGLAALLKRGMALPKPSTTSKSSKPPSTTRIIPFGSLADFASWMLVPVLFMAILIFEVLFLHDWNIISRSIIIAILVIMFIIYVWQSAHRVPEYERMVVFRLGKCIGARGPGLVLILPFIDVPQMVEMRVRHEEVPHETCITQDNVQIDVDFVFYWQIKQPEWSLTRVTDPVESIRLLATAILRAVIAHYDFNDVQTRRESINDLLKVKIDEISSDWGVFVTTMEIREVKASIEIVKAMEKRRAAEWESEAIETLARGQAEALKTLFAIASQIDNKTLNLKYFETLQKLGEGQATKYIFPMELSNLVQSWIPENRNKGDQSDGPNDNPPEPVSGTDLTKK